MGNALLRRVEATLDRNRLEDNPTAPAFRKIFRSWNSTDLWTGLRRYWNEYPKRPEWLSYGDMQHVLCLDEAEAMFLWDACANQGMEMIHRNDMFGSIALYCGSNCMEKGRFFLALFDTNGRGLISINQLHLLVFSALELLGKLAGCTNKQKDVNRELQNHLDYLMEPLSTVYGFEALSKTLCDTRDTLAEDGDFMNDLILGLIEVQELAKFAEDLVDSSFIGKHHSAIENPKRKSPSLVMTNAPSRDFDKEALAKTTKLAETVTSGKTATSSGSHGVEKTRHGGGYASGSESGMDPTTSVKSGPIVVLAEEWISLTVGYPDAKGSLFNPALSKRLKREISTGLGCSDHRVIIQYVGQGVAHIALGGKRLAGAGQDPRTAAQLAYVFLAAMQTSASTLRKGLLKEAYVYEGVKIAEAQCADIDSDPALKAMLQPREAEPQTPTSHAHAVADVGTPSDSGRYIDLPLQIQI